MYYIFENLNSNASWIKGNQGLSEDDINESIALDSLPIDESPEGYTSILKCSKAENRVWYEYVEKIPSSEELKLLTLQEQVDFLNIAMAEILGGAV